MVADAGPTLVRWTMSLDTMMDRLAWETLLLVTICAGWAAVWYATSYWRAGQNVDERPQGARRLGPDHLRALNWVPTVREIPERGAHGSNVRSARLHPAGHARSS